MLPGLLLFLLRWLALPVVLWQARSGKYSWWITTPDDPFARGEDVPHFGHYEETVRAFYAKHGRYWGDVYWLGWRNTLFGLAYYFKPRWLKTGFSYANIKKNIVRRKFGPVEYFELRWIENYSLLRINLGLFGIIWGWRIDNILNSEEGRVVTHPNMDGRPSLSFRSRKAF